MSQTKERIQNFIIFILDFMCILLSYYAAGVIWLYKYKNFSDYEYKYSLNENLFTILIAYVFILVFYSGPQRFTGRGIISELKSVIKKNLSYAAFIAVFELLIRKDFLFPRGVYVIMIILASVLMFVCRMIFKKILIRRSKGQNALRMIAVTTSDRAMKVLRLKYDTNDWMRRLESFIIIDKNMVGREIGDIPVVADAETMLDYIKKEVADEVYIDIDNTQMDLLKTLVNELEDMGVTVHVKLDILEEFSSYDTTMGHMAGFTVATFAHKINAYRKLVVKRCFDIVGSIIGLVIMAVCMIFVAPAIKLESKGPLFFKQKRVGKGGRYFYIYKFRSMYIDAEERKKELMAQNEMDGLMFKMTDDPRITKVGKFIRKTSIDELPQFINVFKGDMSLVGTRPPTVDEFKQYEGRHKRRLTMKPGITGMWQAYGRNSVQDFEDVVKMDLEYIDHWSLGLDLKILIKTVITVFTVGGK